MDLQKWIYGSTEMDLWIYGHQNTWQLIQFVCLSFSCVIEAMAAREED